MPMITPASKTPPLYNPNESLVVPLPYSPSLPSLHPSHLSSSLSLTPHPLQLPRNIPPLSEPRSLDGHLLDHRNRRRCGGLARDKLRGRVFAVVVEPGAVCDEGDVLGEVEAGGDEDHGEDYEDYGIWRGGTGG
jgi:hypothetical protein